MAKANDIIKVEALKLREEGLIITEIVTKTGLSKATLKRLFKSKGLTYNNLSLSHINSEPQINNDQDDDEKVNPTIKSEPGLSEKGSEIVQSDTFKGTKVTFDSKKSAITIGSSDIVDIVGTTPTSPTSPTSPTPEPVPGSYTKSREIVPKQDMDINRPEDPLDRFFSRGMIETLIPIGLIVAGYVMKKSENNDRMDKRGEAW